MKSANEPRDWHVVPERERRTQSWICVGRRSVFGNEAAEVAAPGPPLVLLAIFQRWGQVLDPVDAKPKFAGLRARDDVADLDLVGADLFGFHTRMFS